MDRISTRVTALLGTRYPIVQGGMIWVSGWKLAAAVSRAGGLGLIGAGSMSPDLLATHLDQLAQNVDAPYGVNLPVNHRQLDECVEVCLARGVKIFFTSAGSPKRLTEPLKSAGCTVVHVVPSVALARKVEAAGCDAVVAEGTEAGGHNGFEEVTSVNLWPAVADAVSIPLIAAGGIVDGRGMAAALALGATGVQIGTRFALTEESSASPRYKAAGIGARAEDARLYLRGYMPTRALVNPYVQRAIDAESGGAPAAELGKLRGSGRARLGIFEGDDAEGEFEIGQATGRITRIRPAAEVVERIVAEYTEALAALPQRTDER